MVENILNERKIFISKLQVRKDQLSMMEVKDQDHQKSLSQAKLYQKELQPYEWQQSTPLLNQKQGQQQAQVGLIDLFQDQIQKLNTIAVPDFDPHNFKSFDAKFENMNIKNLKEREARQNTNLMLDRSPISFSHKTPIKQIKKNVNTQMQIKDNLNTHQLNSILLKKDKDQPSISKFSLEHVPSNTQSNAPSQKNSFIEPFQKQKAGTIFSTKDYVDQPQKVEQQITLPKNISVKKLMKNRSKAALKTHNHNIQQLAIKANNQLDNNFCSQNHKGCQQIHQNLLMHLRQQIEELQEKQRQISGEKKPDQICGTHSAVQNTVGPKYGEIYGNLFQGAQKIVEGVLIQQQLQEKKQMFEDLQRKAISNIGGKFKRKRVSVEDIMQNNFKTFDERNKDLNKSQSQPKKVKPIVFVNGSQEKSDEIVVRTFSQINLPKLYNNNLEGAQTERLGLPFRLQTENISFNNTRNHIRNESNPIQSSYISRENFIPEILRNQSILLSPFAQKVIQNHDSRNQFLRSQLQIPLPQSSITRDNSLSEIKGLDNDLSLNSLVFQQVKRGIQRNLSVPKIHDVEQKISKYILAVKQRRLKFASKYGYGDQECQDRDKAEIQNLNQSVLRNDINHKNNMSELTDKNQNSKQVQLTEKEYRKIIRAVEQATNQNQDSESEMFIFSDQEENKLEEQDQVHTLQRQDTQQKEDSNKPKIFSFQQDKFLEKQHKLQSIDSQQLKNTKLNKIQISELTSEVSSPEKRMDLSSYRNKSVSLKLPNGFDVSGQQSDNNQTNLTPQSQSVASITPFENKFKAINFNFNTPIRFPQPQQKKLNTIPLQVSQFKIQSLSLQDEEEENFNNAQMEENRKLETKDFTDHQYKNRVVLDGNKFGEGILNIDSAQGFKSFVANQISVANLNNCREGPIKNINNNPLNDQNDDSYFNGKKRNQMPNKIISEKESNRIEHDENKERQQIQQFFQKFKSKDKKKDIGPDAAEEERNAFARYIDKCEDFKLPPRPFGIVHRKGKPNDLKVNDLAIGDDYAQALASGLQVLETTPTTVILKNNNLTEIGLVPIIRALRPELQILDLSFNPRISLEGGYKILFEAIDSDQMMNLQQLILESNMIGDKIMKELGHVMAQNNSIRLLNICQNKITDEGAKYIAQFLKVNTCCNVLFMRWNQIKAKGASLIAKSLTTNDYLQIWDASFNSFGSQAANNLGSIQNFGNDGTQNRIDEDKVTRALNLSKVRLGQDFCEMFKSNRTLIHVDLSHNSFKKGDCLQMEQGLKENHSLLGLHMIGNDMITNSLGYFQDDNHDPSISHIINRISPSLTTGTLSKGRVELRATSNCWICEGWSQVLFKINPSDVILDKITGKRLYDEMDENTLMYIHLSCDSEEADLMDKDPVSGEFTLLRMVPPGRLTYYYSIGQPPLVQHGSQQTTFTMSYINKKKIDVPNSDIVITSTYLEDLSVLPRPPVKTVAGILRLKTPWDFNKSVFRDYVYDNDALLARCFEYDWNNSKIPKIVKDESELKLIKEFLRANYKQLRECYKHYAGISPQGDVPSIGQNSFQDFINNCQILDSELIKLSDVDLEFISTNAGNKNMRLNPDRALVRYQLMEICVRIAIFKYYKSKQLIKIKFASETVSSYFEAVKMLFDQSVIPFIQKFDSHEWRVRRLWNEDCDIVFKYYYLVLKAVYEKFSGKFSKPGMPKQSINLMLIITQIHELRGDQQLSGGIEYIG